MPDNQIDISAAKVRLAELEQQRAALVTQRQQQTALQAALAAEHRARVAAADLAGVDAPPMPLAPMDPLPDPAELAALDSRIDALASAIADQVEAQELEQLDSIGDTLDRLDKKYRSALLAFTKLYHERTLLLHRWEILYAKAQRRAGRYASDPPARRVRTMIAPETVATWLKSRGGDGVTAAQIAAGETTLEKYKAQKRKGVQHGE